MKNNTRSTKYTNIVAIKEMANGNETVGTMWLETKSFSKAATLEIVMEWAKDCNGKLILTWDESSQKN